MGTQTVRPAPAREADIAADTTLSPRIGAAELERLAALAYRAPDDTPRDWIDVVAPYTGAVLGRVLRGTPADVREGARRARAAQRDWGTSAISQRARVLLRFHDLLLDRREEVLDLVQLESGKTRANAFEEVADVANVARYYAVRGQRFLAPKRRRGAVPLLTVAREYYHPVGVCAFIVPWNYPLNLSISDAIPALMAGNTVLLKPDHHTSFTALWAVNLLYEAGLPRDALVVITGEGPELGPSIIESVDYVMFTGSTRTGRIIAQQAASRLMGYSLELGGKNPMIVCADADIEAAVDGAVRGCFVGAGQVCVSIERIYVDRRIFQRFLDRFAERTRSLRLGAALDYTVDMGSLSFEAQLDRVERHVADARAKGAHVVTGGCPRPESGPLFYEPTILTGVTSDMLCAGEETFGPVVAVYPFDSVDEAIEAANATSYGLSASVWTGDAREGMRVASCIEAGSVNVNEAYNAAWGSVDAPIGGFKESGVSRRHGREGMLKYTEVQTVALQRLIPLAPRGRVGGARFETLVTGLLRLVRRVPGLR